MKPNDLPDMTTVLVVLTVWLTGLATIAWMSIGAPTSVLDLVVPLLLTAGAAGSATLLFTSAEENEQIADEVRSGLILNEVPAGRR